MEVNASVLRRTLGRSLGRPGSVIGWAGLAVAAFLTGIVLAIIGGMFGPLAIVVPVVLVGAVVLTLRAPKWGAAAFIAAIPIGLVQVPGTPLEVVELAAFAAIGLVVFARLVDVRAPLGWHPAISWAAVVTASALLGISGAVNVDAAIGQSLQLLAGTLLVAAVIGAVIGPEDLDDLLTVLLVVGGLTAAYALTQAGSLQASFGGAVVSGRAQGIFAQPNELGSFAGMLLPLAVASFLGADRPDRRWIAAGAGAVVGLALVISLSRGAWIGAGLGLGALMVLLPTVRRHAVTVGSIAVMLIGGLLVLAPDLPQVEIVKERVASISDPSANPYDDRPSIYAEAFRQIGERPLTGFGPGSFPTTSAREASSGRTVGASHAHNALLTFSAEMGLPTTIIIVVFTLAVGYAAYRGTRRLLMLGQQRAATVTAGAAAGLLSVVAHGTVDWALRNPLLFLLAWFLTGLVLAGDRLASRAW